MAHALQRATVGASLAGVFLGMVLVLPARAQLQVGDNVKMNLNGNLSFGYTGDYSNLVGSDHGMTPSGNADLSGSYYNPGFLSFDVQPFYNQSRVNSSYQSVFQSSGVNGTASIFSGSHFPGTVSYNKVYNSEGGLVVPGVGNFTTRGNSDNLVVGWGIHVPDYPNVTFNFADGGNTSSVFGASGDSTFHAKTYGVNVSDVLAGFNLSGGYQHNTVHALTPEFLAGEGPQTSENSSNSFSVNAGHKLPFHGSFSAGASRTDVRSETSGDTFTGNIDTVTSGVGFEPITNLNLGVNALYTNNLEGSLYQPLISAGGVVPTGLLDYSTHSLDINSQASYVLPTLHLTFLASADRREQTLLGAGVSADTLNEMVTYGNDLLGGFVTVTGGATQTTVNFATSSNSKGFFGNGSYTRKVGNWSLTGAGNYARNTQTVLIGYTTSGYGYSAGIGRRIGAYSHWSFNASGAKSVYNNVPGSGNDNQSYSTSLSLKRLSVTGSYGKAYGLSIITPTGLTPISNPIVSPLPTIVFNGKFYSFGASTTPVFGLVLTATYSQAKSNTLANSATSQNTTAQLNTMLQYKVRKLWITGGYLRLQQGFSITGQPASSDSSFFVGITRWFNFF